MDASRIRDAFKQNQDGSWTCIEPVTIEHPQGRVQLVPGTILERGKTFMGVALAEWLDRVSSPGNP